MYVIEDGAATAERQAREHLRIVAEADIDAVESNVTAGYFNKRSADEPIETRGRGPESLKAIIRWLHRAFSELRFDVHEAFVSGERIAIRATMHGRQHGPFVVHDSPDGAVTEVFPSLGKSLAVEHVHLFKIIDGKVDEHDAVRDDLGMAKQLGWIPPRPATSCECFTSVVANAVSIKEQKGVSTLVVSPIPLRNEL
ncbi:MAG: ester cyclase [Pyrinomonadaceae bacterium]